MSTTATAHGMLGQLVKPHWVPLAIDAVRALLRHYPDRGSALAIESRSPRPFSSACVVATTRGPVFIKRHHRSVRDREGLLEEHRFIQHLRANGGHVPQIFATPSGETVIVQDQWTYEVHNVPHGVDLYRDALSWTPFRSSAHARSAGRALAELHQASESFGAPTRKIQPLVASFSIFAAYNPHAELTRYLAGRPSLARHEVRSCAETAIELLLPLHAELQPLLPSLKPLWTHNDLHASNMLWSDASANAQVTSIIDFGLADRTNAVHDLAHAIERNIIGWLALAERPDHPRNIPVQVDHMYAFLDGYESARRLSDQEAAALAPMLALCHIEFALSETDYFLGVLRSEQQARLAYHGWLVGHARWFHSTSGEALLQNLRAWAVRRKIPSVAR